MAEASASESHFNASRRGPCHLFEGTQQAAVFCDDPGAVRIEWNRTPTRTRVEECNANANWDQAEFRSPPGPAANIGAKAVLAAEAETTGGATIATAAATAAGTIAKVESEDECSAVQSPCTRRCASREEQAIIATATTISSTNSGACATWQVVAATRTSCTHRHGGSRPWIRSFWAKWRDD